MILLKLKLQIPRLATGGRQVKKKGEEKAKIIKESITAIEEMVQVTQRNPSWRVLDSYYIYKPFVKITVAETPKGPVYFVEEQGLSDEDKEALEKLYEILMDEIRPPQKREDLTDLRGYVFREIERISDRYREKLGMVGSRKLKLMYYIERNLLGYGVLDPIMKDPNIEDISCNGVGIPIFVWHRKYESIPTNITFTAEEALNELIMKMAHMSGKHISIAYPVLDAMLPEKHRVAATYGREVSTKGPSFTIRKFREKPFSIIEIIEQGNLDTLSAAYLWMLLEHGKTFMIAGGTGTGKSFPKDTLIIAKIDNTPRIVRAEELYELPRTREYVIGEHLVKDMDRDVYVLSVDDENYRLKWVRVRKVIRHLDNRPLVKVYTESSIITTTVDHNFIKIDPETLELKPVKASDLTIGDYIVNTWLNVDYGSVEDVTPDYAYFLGLWSGDGYLEERSKVIGFTNKDDDLIKRYTILVYRLFKKEPQITTDKRNGVKYIRFKDQNLYDELRRLYIEDKSGDVKVPEKILFSEDKSVVVAYLAGLLDSDGSIYLRGSNGKLSVVVEYTSKSDKLISGISFLLKRLRIRHVLRVRNIKGKSYYVIVIYDGEAIKLIEHLKPYISSLSKRETIEAIVKTYKYIKTNTNVNVYPVFNYLKNIRRELGIGAKKVERELGLSNRYLRQYEYGYRKPSQETITKFIKYYYSKAVEEKKNNIIGKIEKLNRLLGGDVYFERVKKIEKIEPTSDYLYDLEVEDTHNFVIGEVGWRLNHNTTMLNALSMFIKPGMKIVTIEDTPELNLPHVNWVQLTSRETYVVGTQSLGTSVKLYDLVKLSLRYRPDYVIVGEVRGEEASVLFQAMATGHSGASTIHAETLDYAVKRLTSPPMNIPPTYMRLMNVFMHIQRVITRVEKGVVQVRRRVTVIQEVEDYEKYRLISKWDPRTDSHIVNLKESMHLEDVALKKGWDVEDVIEEIKRRALVLEWMKETGIKDAWDVSRVIFDYYYEPKTVYETAVKQLAELKSVSSEKVVEEVSEEPRSE